MPQQTLAIDFDGVIHAYTGGWQGGAIYDTLVPGTPDAIRTLSYRYRLVVFTARYNLDDVKAYLHKYHIGHFFADVTNRKPEAVAYIDDRAIRFHDWPQTLRDVQEVAR